MSKASAPRFISLSFKLSAIIALIVITILSLMTLVTTREVYKTKMEDSSEDIAAITEFIADIYDLEIESIMRILQAYSQNPTFLSDWEENDFSDTRQVFTELSTNLLFLENILLFDPLSGEIRMSKNPRLIGTLVGNTEVFSKVNESGSTSVIEQKAVISERTGNPVITLAVPLLKDGETKAIFAVVLDLVIFSDTYAFSRNVGTEGVISIIDKDGMVVASSLSELNLTDLSGEEFVKTAILAESPESLVMNSWLGKSWIFGVQSITGLPWFIVTAIPEAEISAQAGRITLSLVRVSFISIIILTGLILLCLNIIVLKRLKMLSSTIEIASSGDLTVKTAIVSNDELTVLAGKFNALCDNLCGMLSVVSNTMGNLRNTGDNLSSNVTETAASVEEITMNIESTRNEIIKQSQTVVETSSIIEVLTLQIESLDKAIDHQNTAVLESNTAVEAMLGNANAITTTVESAGNNVDVLRSSSEDGKKRLAEMVDQVRNISKASENLQEANTLISNIAAQTNLLAMNAAIEASHAGANGKGFSVVADEIKKLAELSSSQAGTIEKNLKSIQTMIKTVLNTSKLTTESFDHIVLAVVDVTEKISHIRNAMLSQNAGNSLIVSNLNQIKGISSDVRKSSATMFSSTEKLHASITSLNSIAEEIRGAIEEISGGTREINTAVSEIRDMGLVNRESISEVSKGVDLFTFAR